MRSAGVDIVSDGEMSKPSYATYVKHRVDGIGMDGAAAEQGRQVMLSLDRLDHPDFVTPTGFANVPFPACLGPLRYADRGPLERDIVHLRPHIARIQDNVLEPPKNNPGPNVILQYRFNAQTGRLSPNTPHRVEQGDLIGPRHYIHHPSLDVVYFSNEQGCSVTAYRLDRASGTLSSVQTISTLPAGHSERHLLADPPDALRAVPLCRQPRG
jgi:hypothetical protein